MARPPKKSETLELRIPHATKQAFMTRCRDEGRGASETMRMLIDGHLNRRVRTARHLLLRVMAGVAIATGAAAVALPSVAATAAKAGYEGLDRNRDGVVGVSELAALDVDGDGVVSLSEFRAP